MIQPSIHKRYIESSRMVVCGALFDMRDLAQMPAHVHDAAMESAKVRRRHARRGAHAAGRPRLIVQAATFPSPRCALLRFAAWTGNTAGARFQT